MNPYSSTTNFISSSGPSGNQGRNPYGRGGNGRTGPPPPSKDAADAAAAADAFDDSFVIGGDAALIVEQWVENDRSLPVSPPPPPPPVRQGSEETEIHPYVSTTSTTTTTAAATSLIHSLQTQLEELQETNFDLQASMAAMQAEQSFTIQQVQHQTNKDISNLQHQLRLEQQTTQRLLLSLQQQQQQQQQQKQKQGPQQHDNNDNDDVFRRRIFSGPSVMKTTTTVGVKAPPKVSPATATDFHTSSPSLSLSPGPPPEITTLRRSARSSLRRSGTDTATTATPLPSSPQEEGPAMDMDNPAGDDPILPTTATVSRGHTTMRRHEGGAPWLARQLLLYPPPPDSTDVAASATVHRLLVQLATQHHRDSPPTTTTWSECQLVEYLFQRQKHQIQRSASSSSSQTDLLLPYWEHALLRSSQARQGVLNAMKEMERNEQQQQPVDHEGTALLGVPTVAHERRQEQQQQQQQQRRHVPRIHRLNPDGSKGPAFTKQEQSLRLQSQRVMMSPETVHNWVGNSLDINNPRHLHLLALVLEDCPPHSTSLWWNVLLPGIARQIVHLHAQFTTPKEETLKDPSTSSVTPSTRNTMSHRRHRTSSVIISRRRNYSWVEQRDVKRWRFQCPVLRESRMDDETRDLLLLATMTLMERLVACTRLEILDSWYKPPTDDGGVVGVPKQPDLMEDPGDAADESAHLWIGLLLDIVESLDCFGSLQKRVILPGWYVQLVSLFSTIGRTTFEGMKVLRSRLPDSTGGEVRPNVIDTAGLQLFQLSLMDSEDETGYLDTAHEQRLFVMGYWLRLLQLILEFAQSTSTTATATVPTSTTATTDTTTAAETISFRSLVVDIHDYYTSACTRIMTDAFVDSDTVALIRSQLEELAMDQEEHDDLKYK